MAKRIRPEAAPLIADLEGANRALEELAALGREEDLVKAGLNELIDRAKAEAEERLTPVLARRRELEGALNGYALMIKSERFKSRQTLELGFGRFGFRRSSRLQTAGRGVNWEMVLDKLKRLALFDGIRVKEEVDKDELKTWPAEKLGLVGVKKTETETFWYETEEIQPGTGRAA